MISFLPSICCAEVAGKGRISLPLRSGQGRNPPGELVHDGSCIDRLYVDPGQWCKGWGTRFINLAKQLSQNGLELHTHQANHAPGSLQVRQGFQAVKFDIRPTGVPAGCRISLASIDEQS
jgi:hypothetical protein